MGMYTCLKFTGQLKKEFYDFVKENLTDETFDKYSEDFEVWHEFVKTFGFGEVFAKKHRADFIPFGCASYNADKMGREGHDEDLRFSNVVSGIDTDKKYPLDDWADTWVFQCDLKNYEDEIETFIADIAVKICDKFVAEMWYEEFAFPTVYIFKDDKLAIM